MVRADAIVGRGDTGAYELYASVNADDQGSGSREVHVFRGLVRPGNSGGALLDLDGEVLGLVFANAQDDDETGFALTRAEVAGAIAETRRATAEVPSGPCRKL